MGQPESMDQELYIQALKAFIFEIRGSRVRSLQLIQFLDFVQDTCQCFPEEGTVNLETWNKVEDWLRVQYVDERLDSMPIFTFGLWFMIKDCFRPTPSHKDFRLRYSRWDVGFTPYNQASRSVRGSVP
jgi:hypothetical protein